MAKQQYHLLRDWKYTPGPEDQHAKVLPAGTVIGTVEVEDGIPMVPRQVIDAVYGGLAAEVKEADADRVSSSVAGAKKGRAKVTDE